MKGFPNFVIFSPFNLCWSAIKAVLHTAAGPCQAVSRSLNSLTTSVQLQEVTACACTVTTSIVLNSVAGLYQAIQ
jgi:hypothetical protein